MTTAPRPDLEAWERDAAFAGVQGEDLTALPFSVALDAYLDLRDAGPRTNLQGTDKRYYEAMRMLRDRMDQLAPIVDNSLFFK